MKSDQKSGMGNPELLLQGLNAALRELRGAAHLLEELEIDELLQPLMRRLMLAELLSKEWIVAIGGSQGAGKTTLLRTAYGFTGDDAQWLQPNEGRGERIPVLVLEDAGRSRVQGAVRLLADMGKGDFRMMEKDLTQQEFQRAISDPAPGYLLPVLKVPSRFFINHPNQAWLLLPGYEKEDRRNKEWQRLMRQALVAAAGCVIVTDETRMANQQQVDIVKDMLANELRGAQAMVVISKTEAARGDAERQKVLRSAAQRVFGIAPERVDRWIVCAGSDDPAYVAEWLPNFSSAVEELSSSGGGNRKAQLEQVETLLTRDLTALIVRIEMKARLFFQGKDGGEATAGEDVVRSLLEAFDGKCSDLRNEYQRLISGMLDKKHEKSWKNLEERLIENHEGVINHIKNISKKATEIYKSIEDDVSAAWRSTEPLLDEHAAVVAHITQRELGYTNMTIPDQTPTSATASGSLTFERLGYMRGQEMIKWNRPDDDEQHNLRVIFAGRGLATKAEQRTTKGLERAIRLLPALALEYTRLASLLPEVVSVDRGTLQPTDMPQRPDLVKQTIDQLSDGVNLGRTVLRGLAAVLAIDVAVDGDLDIPGVLSKTAAAAGTAGTAAASAVSGVAAAVVGLVAVGYLVHSAVQQSRQHDEQVRVVMQQLLQNIRDLHQTHFMCSFDVLMGQLRALLLSSLRERYHLDEAAMERDRLNKALADVRALKRDLLEELARSGGTVSPFNVPEEIA